MHINIYEDKVLISGKAWEIHQRLKEAQKKYTFVKDWIKDLNHPTPPTSLNEYRTKKYS